MKVFRKVALLLVTLALAAACAPRATEPPSRAITVMAAASLTGAFEEIGARFEEQHPGAQVAFNFAGSQQLSQQLAQGAPADVFASANLRQMEAVMESGRIAPQSERIFAQNRLVIIAPADNPGNVSGWESLAEPGVKLVLAAPEVPAGQYSLEFLKKASQSGAAGAAFQASVENNIVSYEDNIRAVLTKVLLGEADAGIVYASDITGSAAEQVQQIPIPDALNVIASYPIGIINDSAHPDLAQAFVDFVLSQQGQSILAKHSFLPAAK